MPRDLPVKQKWVPPPRARADGSVFEAVSVGPFGNEEQPILVRGKQVVGFIELEVQGWVAEPAGQKVEVDAQAKQSVDQVIELVLGIEPLPAGVRR